jgi:AmpE protein
MALRLLAVLIALALVAWLPQLRGWRDFRWFRAWTAQWGDSSGAPRVALALLPPVVLVAVVGFVFGRIPAFGVLWLLFAVLVLLYTLGPRRLEADIDAVLQAPDRPQREAMAQALRVDADGAPLPLAAPELVEAAVLSALKRRFGVLLWFLLLGPAGAMLYRLAQRLANDPAPDPASRSAARRVAEVLDWLPAHLMVFAMALVSDFDAVMNAWRRWHADPARSSWAFEPGFLGAVARAGVDADVEAGDGYAEDVSDPMLELSDVRRLLLRVLVVWLAVAAILVLAGWAM